MLYGGCARGDGAKNIFVARQSAKLGWVSMVFRSPSPRLKFLFNNSDASMDPSEEAYGLRPLRQASPLPEQEGAFL